MAAGKQFLKGLMDNPNFQKWFGESAVRDAEGLPLEVYHGTKKDFEQFIPGGTDFNSRTGNVHGDGIYFTVEPDQAGAYSRGYGGRILSGFLNGKIADFNKDNQEMFSAVEKSVGKRLQEGGDYKASFDLGARRRYYPENNEDGMSFFDTQKKNWEYFDGYKDRNKPIVDKDEKGVFVEYNDMNTPGVFTMDDKWSGFDRLKSYFGGDVSNIIRDAGYDGHRIGSQIVVYDPTTFKSRFNAGTFDPTDPNFLKSAGLMTAGAGAAAYGLSPDDAEAAYIGPKGLANLLGPDAAKSLLTEAEQMAAQGVDNEAVRQATGMFKGMDGKWRFEVDDSGAGWKNGGYMSPEVKKASGMSYVNSPASLMFDHAELYKAYPDIADVNVTMKGYGNGGGMHSSAAGLESISLDNALQPVPQAKASDGPFAISQQEADAINAAELSKGTHRIPDPQGARGTLLHELQHAIQQREGFARGGSPSEFTQIDDAKLARDALAFRRELDKMPAGMDSLAKENAIVKDYQDMDAMDFLPSREARDLAHDRDYNPDDQLTELVKAYGLDKHVDMTPKRAYDWLAGEIEARDVAARMNLTPEQRRSTPPDLRDNAIVRFDQNAPQEAAGLMGYNAKPRFSVDPQRVAAEAITDAYSPIDMLVAGLSGGGGLMARLGQAAIDPAVNAAFEYVPKFADAINPRNIIQGLMR